MATVRYLVHDVAVAADFYVGGLGFELVQSYGPAMAIVRRGDLSLWLAGPAASAARPMPDGRQPSPGGWNRIVVETADIEALAATLKAAGVVFRNRSSAVRGNVRCSAKTRPATRWSCSNRRERGGRIGAIDNVIGSDP
jgi:catechol 2,3-dioxygenase-like lactoylglutathione lyase family enzyme